MRVNAGKYNIEAAQDDAGKTIFVIRNRNTGKLMPGHYEFMSTAVMAAMTEMFKPITFGGETCLNSEKGA